MEDFYQRIVSCPYGCHLVFVARQEQHLAECDCRKVYLAGLSAQELAAQKKVCRFDKAHIVNDVELNLHEMKCCEEYTRKMMKKQREEFGVMLRKFFGLGSGTEKAREAYEELVPSPEPKRDSSGGDDKGGYSASTHMIFDLEL